MNELLDYLGLDALELGKEKDPVQGWLRRFERVRDWIHRSARSWTPDPTPEQVQGDRVSLLDLL